MTNKPIQPLWLTYLIEILLVLEFQLTKTYFGTFSYKAHFRPQISSNVLAILSKLGSNYSVFVSTFHATKLTARACKIPSLANFMESLTQQQDKLVMMGTIKPSKDQDLVAGDSRVDSKSKRKLKSHLRKEETRSSLRRINKVPRKIPRRRKTKVI